MYFLVNSFEKYIKINTSSSDPKVKTMQFSFPFTRKKYDLG